MQQLVQNMTRSQYKESNNGNLNVDACLDGPYFRALIISYVYTAVHSPCNPGTTPAGSIKQPKICHGQISDP